MAEITASLVKELRERTGAGMMECKKALTENNGDIDAAAEWLRKSGLAKADKKADRVAAEGRIAVAQDGGKAVLVEVNSETDFVAKDENFVNFVNAVAQAALASDATDVEALKAAKLATGATVEEARASAIAKLGENIQIRRMARISSNGNVAAYVHGGKIGVLVDVAGGDAELARGLAMHIAAMNPPYNKAADVPVEFVAKEKEIELAKMSEKDKAKPAEILEKIISGKIAKIVNEVTLYGQPYVLEQRPDRRSRRQGRRRRRGRLPAPGGRRRHREGGRGLRRRSDEAGRPGVSRLLSHQRKRPRAIAAFSLCATPERGVAGQVWRSHPGLLQKGRSGRVRFDPARQVPWSLPETHRPGTQLGIPWPLQRPTPGSAPSLARSFLPEARPQ